MLQMLLRLRLRLRREGGAGLFRGMSGGSGFVLRVLLVRKLGRGRVEFLCLDVDLDLGLGLGVASSAMTSLLCISILLCRLEMCMLWSISSLLIAS
jgi:hypothetical protein